jgi:hypothetical protein
METARVDIDYRPLRIGWLISSTDRDAFRKAVKYCNAFWGGRFNPIILVDRPTASAMVELYAPDFLMPLGKHEELQQFSDKYPHLKNPLMGKLYKGRSDYGPSRSSVLDIQNLLVHWRHHPEWNEATENSVKVAHWADDDPLADVFLAQFGAYPDVEDCGIDYREMLSQATATADVRLASDRPIPDELLRSYTVSKLARFGIETQSERGGWDTPGFYVGSAGNLDDLVNFWNLRAAGVALSFHDPAHKHRYELIDNAFERALRADLATAEVHTLEPAIWTRREFGKEARKAMGDGKYLLCHIDDFLWNGRNLKPCSAIFGNESALGVIGAGSVPRISFALSNKPFCGDVWFYSQHLMASVRLFGIFDEGSMFIPPYVPELNEFYGRIMALHHDRVRVEQQRIAFVIDAADRDVSFNAVPVASLIERIFDLGGFKASLSGGGLIARQLIARMGGADGARAFKIPGVRRLLKQYGPNESFSANAAWQLIGGRDPQNPRGSFADHKWLFIEPRDWNEELTPKAVFAHLVEKGLFRIGVDLRCPTCALKSWIPLDYLQQDTKCQLCGAAFDATRQLVEERFAYRRSGVLGLERNIQGAVPVAVVLQQLSVVLHGLSNQTASAASYDLVPKDGSEGKCCETDFVYLARHPREAATDFIIGEVKDVGGTIDENDVRHLRVVAESLPQSRFNTFIVLAKLGPFTEEEIALAATLNSNDRRRVIMLTDRELEPYDIYGRAEKELGEQLIAVSADDLAAITHKLYFEPRIGLNPGADTLPSSN